MALGETETENSSLIPDETKAEAEQQSTTSEVGEAVRKQLIVAVEGTAAVGAFWRTIFSEYLEKIIRCFCGNKSTDEKDSKDLPELSLIVFTAHGPYSACLVQRSGWTTNMEVFFQWLSALPFVGGGFSDAAIAEGLAEALMMFSSARRNENQNGEAYKHCVLIAASNPYPLPRPVYRPQLQNLGKSNGIETQPYSPLYDAETLAKYFPQCAISLSVICPKQLPKLRGIYNTGKRDPQAADPAVDNVKNPQFLVLISENFMDARASLNRTGTADLPSPVPYLSDNPIASVVPLGASGATVPTPAMSQQGQSDMQCAAANSNSPTAHEPVPQPPSSALQSAEPKYVKVWEGDLYEQRHGQSLFVTKLVGFGKASSKTLAENWPPAIRIDYKISKDYMSNEKSIAHADRIVFQAMNQHVLLVELHEKNLCAVIGLPSQTMFLGVSSDKVQRLIGMVFPQPISRGFRRTQQNHQQQQTQSQMQQQQETQRK